MRGSSVHFMKIQSAMQSVSHASREVPPSYLLPKEVSLGTHIVLDDSGEVNRRLIQKTNLASRQAKASKDYSPLWEGVINLPEPSKEITPAVQVAILKKWCAEYEKITGHKVLRADVHLDEGYVDSDGKAHFNAHAHAMCDRTDDLGRVKKLTPAQLRDVQSMTAEVTQLDRGLDARKTRRQHIGHQQFKFTAEQNRRLLDEEKENAERCRILFAIDTTKVSKMEDKINKQGVELAELKAAYAKERAGLKASGTATQANYQGLKQRYEQMEALARKLHKQLQESNVTLQRFAEKGLAIEKENVLLREKVAAHELERKQAQESTREAQEAFELEWGHCETKYPYEAVLDPVIANHGQRSVHLRDAIPYLVDYPEGTVAPKPLAQEDEPKHDEDNDHSPGY